MNKVAMPGGTFRDSRCATETAMDAGLAQHRTCRRPYKHFLVHIPALFNQSIAELPGAFHAMSTPAAAHLDLR